MKSATKQLGALGEEAAAKHLQRSGHVILGRNYSCTLGELDIITFHQGTIVFVEVKTRAGDEQADPEDNITPTKQRQLQRVAEYWLAHKRRPNCAYRFDAVSVVFPDDGRPRIRHIIEAFIPS